MIIDASVATSLSDDFMVVTTSLELDLRTGWRTVYKCDVPDVSIPFPPLSAALFNIVPG
jgi:hypothetical protein